MTAAVAYRPDLVLTDLRMPGRDVAACPTRVVVLATCDPDILRAVEAGACGYLLKCTPHPELVAAIRAAAHGETVLAPPAAAGALRGPAWPVLTGRESRRAAGRLARAVQPRDRRRLHSGEATEPSAAHVREAAGAR